MFPPYEETKTERDEQKETITNKFSVNNFSAFYGIRIVISSQVLEDSARKTRERLFHGVFLWVAD